MTFSVLSFNTFGTPYFAPKIRERYQKIAEEIIKENIDILCLQEVSTYYHLLLLKKYLPNYPYLCYKKYLFGPKGGVVIFSKIPLEDCSYGNFSTLGSLSNVSFYTQLIKNGMLICKIKDHDTYILNTHLVSDFEFEESQTNTLYNYVKMQVEEVAQKINEIAHKGGTIVTTGDFNMKKGSKLYEYLLQETHATDAFSKDSFPTYYNDRDTYRFKGKTSERIDFIFVKEGEEKITIKNTAHMLNDKTEHLSDHIGLKVNFDTV